ncbi:MAG TPA: SRPBCC domain-containing protein [Acidimicrobiales bacterium]|jgi:uncharacterized protein YndB with AHSA1/START domain|nr:SRPBCC domain-containing protein [Acidimicrobiales bacterium]
METRREVQLPATVEDVWPCLSEADALGDWLGGTLTMEDDTVEPGATGTFVDGADGIVRQVLVDGVDPGRAVSWTWWTDDEDEPPSSVSIVLDPAPDAVRVVVVERQLVFSGPVAMAAAGAACG